MSHASEIKVGTIGTVKVGRNEVTVTVIDTTRDGWVVKSQRSGKVFEVKKLERLISEELGERSEKLKNKKISLINAAAKVLETESPLSAKELVERSIALGLWIPKAGKTPEQSLYSAISREISAKEHPRFRKSVTRKGSFELNLAS